MKGNPRNQSGRYKMVKHRTWPLLFSLPLLLLVTACTLAAPSTPTPPAATRQATESSPTATGAPTATPQATAAATVVLQPSATPPLPTANASRPTATPLPPSPIPTAQATIHYFRANVAVTDPGETITLEWRWSGGTGATIYHLLPSGQLGTPRWDVDPTGSLTVEISPQARNNDRFALFVYDDDGLQAQETVEIELRCPDEWFFDPAPDVCPARSAITTDGAEQPFERGVMLWNRAEDRIYVLFDDDAYPRWQAYEDVFDEGEDPASNPDIEPPPGLYQPIRGFGMVWRQQTGVRERLGWALAPETGYQTMIQRTSYFKYNETYIRALDGGVWRLGPEGSEWEHIE